MVSETLAAAMEHFQKQLRECEEAKDYLKSRGLDGKTALLYKIGYAPNEWHGLEKALGFTKAQLTEAGLMREKDEKTYDYFRHRIIFPIIEGGGRVCAFGGRALAADEPAKYLNSAESAHFSKRFVLFGLPQAAKAAQEKKRLIICEGYMDVVMLAQGGFPESVATMGTAATEEQMKKALGRAPNVYLAYDGDEAGRKGAFRAVQGILPALKDGASVFFLFLPQGHDPDSFLRESGGKAFEQLLADATPLGDYIVETLWQNAAAASEEGRATSVMKEGGELLRLVDKRAASAWYALLAKKLEERTGLPLSALGAGVRAARVRARPSSNAAYKMPDASVLYHLLCLLSANPQYADRLPHDLPLPGGEQEVAVLSEALDALRWQMPDEEDEEGEGGAFDLPAHLEKQGYTRLARQLRKTLRDSFSGNEDRTADLDALVARLREKQQRLARRGKKEWLAKLREQDAANDAEIGEAEDGAADGDAEAKV